MRFSRLRGLATLAIVAGGLVGSSSVFGQSAEEPAYVTAYNEYQALLEAGDLAEAQAKSRTAYALARESLGETNGSTITLALNYATLSQVVGRDEEAHQTFVRLVEIYDSLYGPESPRLVRVLLGAGTTMPGSAAPVRLEYFRRALRIQQQAAPEDPAAYATLAADIASQLADREQTRGEAVEIAEAALTRAEASFGKDSPDIVALLLALGKAQAEIGDSRRQEKLYDRARTIYIASHPEDRVALADMQLKMGREVTYLARTSGGGRYLEAAHEIYESELGRANERTAAAALALGEYELARERYFASEPLLLQALDVFGGQPDYVADEIRSRSLLIRLYETEHERDAAAEHAMELANLMEWRSVQEYQPIVKFAPEYPSVAARRGLEGYVVVQYTVDATGAVKDPVIVESSAEVFEGPALESVETYRYIPRVIDGQTVDVPGVRTIIRFGLVR